MTPEAATGDVIVLEDVPVTLFLESQDHQHDLIRELQLVEIGDRYDVATAQVSHQLAQLIEGILSAYQPVRSATRQQALAAFDRGVATITLEVPVRPGMADALRCWLQLLEQADELCERGELLLLAPRPEIRELRRWYVDQLTERLERRASALTQGAAGE